MGKYFGTDGFRGEAGVNLTADHAYKVGCFLGWYYNALRERNGNNEPARIVIGKDTRRSSYMFEYSLVAGLATSGADAYLLHVTTTPSVAYIARVDDFDCGIMISASHNPYYDNGIKLIDCYGEKMPEEILLLVEDYIDGKLHVFDKDWVELPFGKDDAPRKGQVKAIMDCTRTVAPWPPEQTKTVIQIIAAPEGEQTTETAAPNVEQHIAPPEGVAEQPKEVEEPEKTEGPAVPEQSAEPKAPEVPSQPVEPVAPNEPDKGEEPPPPQKKSVIQQKPVRPKKPFPMKEFVKALLAVAVVAGVAIAFLTHEKRQAAAYEEALDALSRGKYISAEQSFSDLSGYRDAEPLSVYCKYMNIYQNATEYEGGLWELSKIRMRYNMDLQKQVDALIFRVERYSAAEKAADAAKKEAQRKEQYSGKLPVDGMPTSSLKYTSLGSPTKTEKCRFYDDMDTYRRYKILTWSNDEGQIVATCHSQQKRGETEETISSFTYHDPPIGRPDSAPPLVPPFGPSDSSGHTGSIRDDYDTPEDLWEENQDWYEDEDEAWDEWYDG